MAQNKTFRAQFLSGAGANAYSQAVTIFTQLVSIPVMVTFWGADMFGSWLALSALPTYLSLADLGMGQITGNEMTMAIARDDRDQARKVNQAAWVMIGGIAFSILPLAVLVAVFVPLADFLNVVEDQRAQTGPAFVLLTCSTGLSLAFGVLGGGLKAVGLYWVGVATTATHRLLSFSGLIVVALLGGGFLPAASVMVGGQILLFGAVGLWFYRREAWLLPRLTRPDLRLIRRLLVPSLSYMLYYLNNLLTIQSVNILVSAVLGPAAVVVMQAIRTLTRIGRMFSTVAIRSLQPIFAQMSGQGSQVASKKTFRILVWATVVGTAVYALGIVAFGPIFLKIWTRGVVVEQNTLLYLMTVAIVFEILWATLQAPFTSTNRHSIFAFWLILSSGAALILNWALLDTIGIDAAGWSLMASNLSVLLFTIWRILRFGI